MPSHPSPAPQDNTNPRVIIYALLGLALFALLLAVLSIFWGGSSPKTTAAEKPARAANPCGPPVRLIAYPGQWSDEVAKRPNCAFIYDRDFLRGGAAALEKTIHVRRVTRGKVCEEKLGGGNPQTCFGPIGSLYFMSAELGPVPVVVQFCPVGWGTCPDD